MLCLVNCSLNIPENDFKMVLAIFFHSLWKFPLCNTTKILLKNGDAKDSWKMTNHHYVSLLDLSSLHDTYYSCIWRFPLLYILLYQILPSRKSLSNSPGNKWNYGQVYLAKVTIYFYFWRDYILSCNTTLEVMAVGWQLLLWIAFTGLSSLQDAINPQRKYWRLNSKSVPILILN